MNSRHKTRVIRFTSGSPLFLSKRPLHKNRRSGSTVTMRGGVSQPFVITPHVSVVRVDYPRSNPITKGPCQVPETVTGIVRVSLVLR